MDASGSWEMQPHWHSLYAKLTPNSCDDGTGSQCTIIGYGGGVGAGSASASGGENHAHSTIAQIDLRAYSYSHVIMTVEGSARIGYDTNTHGPVTFYGNTRINHSTGFSTGCGSDGNCGTYDVSADSYAYIYVWVPDD